MKPLHLDWFLVLIVLVLLAIGTVMIYSASSYFAHIHYNDAGLFFERHLIWLGVALLLGFVTWRIDYHKLVRWAPGLLVAGIVLLIAVLFFPEKRGVHRWIHLGSWQFQPSEVFKLAVILYVAQSLARRGAKIMELSYLLLPYAPLLGVAFLLIMLEPDLGTVLVITGTVFLSLVIAGARWKHLVSSILVFALVVAILVLGFGYKKERMIDYIKGWEDPLKSSYQVRQGILGISLGGITGAGLGEGKQKWLYLPAPHTDFIFAAIGEEGGLLGLAVILALFFLLIWRGWLIAQQARDPLGFFLAFAVAALIFVSVTLNVGVVLGLLPTTGIPLPFFSYGGSSLVVCTVACGMLLSISAHGSKGFITKEGVNDK